MQKLMDSGTGQQWELSEAADSVAPSPTRNSPEQRGLRAWKASGLRAGGRGHGDTEWHFSVKNADQSRAKLPSPVGPGRLWVPTGGELGWGLYWSNMGKEAPRGAPLLSFIILSERKPGYLVEVEAGGISAPQSGCSGEEQSCEVPTSGHPGRETLEESRSCWDTPRGQAVIYQLQTQPSFAQGARIPKDMRECPASLARPSPSPGSGNAQGFTS